MSEAEFDRYALLSVDQWAYVVSTLWHDLETNRQGIVFVAPDDATEKEISVCFELETSGIKWAGCDDRPLSRAIIEDNPDLADELYRAAHSLETTRQRLLAKAAEIEARRL